MSLKVAPRVKLIYFSSWQIKTFGGQNYRTFYSCKCKQFQYPNVLITLSHLNPSLIFEGKDRASPYSEVKFLKTEDIRLVWKHLTRNTLDYWSLLLITKVKKS